MAPLLLLALAGFLAGGVWTFWRAGNRGPSVLLAVFALMSIAAAALWAWA
ncbi:MAG: hypothetical protein ABI468_02560 [Candidatus Nanopelagicales bacterium]